MEKQKNSLHSFRAWHCYVMALFFCLLTGLTVSFGIMLFQGNIRVWYILPAVLLLAIYFGFSLVQFIVLGLRVQKAISQSDPDIEAMNAPLMWSNGIITQEKAYRKLQEQHPKVIEKVRYYNQFPSRLAGLLALVLGLNRRQQKKFVHFFLSQPQPLRVKPQVQSYVWGRKAVESSIIRFLQLVLHASQQNLNIAELWFGAHKKNPGRISFGGFNMDMDQFAQAVGEVLLGQGRREIGQLFKMLDAVEPLSLQMHERFQPDSKNECWMMVIDRERLSAKNQDQTIAELYLGFRLVEEVDDAYLPGFKAAYHRMKTPEKQQAYFKERYGQALKKGIRDKQGLEIKAFCNKYELRWESGQVELYLNDRKQSAGIKQKYGLDDNRFMINIPGATVHALIFGTIYELQETADKTLRLYDHGRNIPNRPLHIEEALMKLDFTPRHPLDFVISPIPVDVHTVNLISTPLYALDEIVLKEKTQIDIVMTQSYHMLVVTKSEGENCLLYAAQAGQKIRLPVKQGDMLIVPATQKGYALFAQGSLKVLKAYEATTQEMHMLQIRRGMAFWEQAGFFEKQN